MPADPDQPDKPEPGGIELTINPDGSITETRFGPQRPKDLTPEELQPWLALAYSRMLQSRQATPEAKPEPEASKPAAKKKTAATRRRPPKGKPGKGRKR